MNSLNKKYWQEAFLFLLIIYATIPVARPLTSLLRKHIPFTLTINLVSIAILAAALMLLLAKIKVKLPSTYVLIGIFTAICLFLLTFIKIPEEKIHFFEYGILAYLTFRALRLTRPEKISYFYTAFLVALAGWLDEGIQALVPGRYYDLRDVGFNAMGGLLGIFIVWIIKRETRIEAPPTDSF